MVGWFSKKEKYPPNKTFSIEKHCNVLHKVETATSPQTSSSMSSDDSSYQFLFEHCFPFFKRGQRSKERFLNEEITVFQRKQERSPEEVFEFKSYKETSHSPSNEESVVRGGQCKQSIVFASWGEEIKGDLRRSSSTSSLYNNNLNSGSLASLAITHEMVALTLGDFRFKGSDLKFNHLLSSGRRGGKILKGKCQVWKVNIHSSIPQNDVDVREWLSDVEKLSNTRHENIVLYMGACVEPPNFLIITNLITSNSLYASIMFQGINLNKTNKLSILRQTANALSYLHHKGIVHGQLSSHNIFLETTVKVSLLDHSSSSLNLQFCSPEIVRNIYSDDRSAWEKSKHGDVFAFGSVMYQLFTQKLPLDNLPSQTILYQTGLGYLPRHLPDSLIYPGMSSIIKKCWSQEIENRPTLPDLCNQLQPPIQLIIRTCGLERLNLTFPTLKVQ